MKAKLVFSSGSMKGSEVELVGPQMSVGRDPGMTVVIPKSDAEYVSRHHATLFWSEDEGWVVEDKASTNGTWVNGVKTDRRVLRQGDVVRFGHDLEARFIDLDPATSLAPGSQSDETRVVPRAPAAPAPVEGVTVRVQRELGKHAEETRRQGRKRGLVAAVVGLLLVGGGGYAAWSSGVFEPEPEEVFSEIAAERMGSVFLVELGFRIGDLYRPLAHGTAFAVEQNGVLVTNKNVIRPHRYNPEVACIEASFARYGLSFEDSLQVSVWPGGSEFRQEPGDQMGDRGLGYTSDNGTLRVIGLASDQAERPIAIPCVDLFSEQGQRFEAAWTPHERDNTDLAVLQINGNPTPFPLAEADPLPNEPVMVLGFPNGIEVLEGTVADPIWRHGRVIRVQATVQTDAVVQQGNSGGPLLNQRGEVVGVTTRGIGDLFNTALRGEYVRILVDRSTG